MVDILIKFHELIFCTQVFPAGVCQRSCRQRRKVYGYIVNDMELIHVVDDRAYFWGGTTTTTSPPVLPVLPVSPLSPSAPVEPTSPFAPLSPAAPVAPVGPGTATVAPAEPVAPVAPAGPGTTTTGCAGVLTVDFSQALRPSTVTSAPNSNEYRISILLSDERKMRTRLCIDKPRYSDHLVQVGDSKFNIQRLSESIKLFCTLAHRGVIFSKCPKAGISILYGNTLGNNFFGDKLNAATDKLS
jgi:hypothetical protein